MAGRAIRLNGGVFEPDPAQVQKALAEDGTSVRAGVPDAQDFYASLQASRGR